VVDPLPAIGAHEAAEYGLAAILEQSDRIASAIVIGALAGLVPAVRASRMPPTVALRTV
jgi:hypothetical protein